MNVNVINSGSDGNAIILEKSILLDCGVNYSKIKQYLKEIKIIFISHCHTDHLLPSTIKKIAYNYPTKKYIVGSEDIVVRLVDLGVKKQNIYLLKENMWYDLGMFKAKLEALYHDIPNHLIKIQIKDKKAIYIVDTATIKGIEAYNYDLYLIENNYNEEEINKRIEEKQLNGEFIHELRVKNSHLSNEECDKFLMDNMGDKSEYIYIHQHKEKEINNENV